MDAALRTGVLVRDARGRYALPNARQGARVANSIAGVLSHRSAAHRWGWAQKDPRGLPEVTVPRSRRVDRSLRKILIPHWSNLPAEDIEGSVTTMRRTLVDCMRNLPLDEALAIADSAVRADDVTPEELWAIAVATRGRGRRRILAVAEQATGRAANPLESVLRAQALQIPGLEVVAQHPIEVSRRLTLHPDLADPDLMIGVEAEGFEWHGVSAELTRDCRRYNALELLGWHVIRFSWYQVMFEPAYVQRVLLGAVALARERQTESSPPGHANVA